MIFHSNVIYQRVCLFLAGSRMLFFHGTAGCEKKSRLIPVANLWCRGKQSKPPGAVRFSQWIPSFIPNIKKGLSLSWAMWVNPSGPPSTTVRLSAPLRPKSLSKSIKSYFSGWLNQMLWVLLVKLPFWRIKMSQFCWSYPFNSAQIWNLLTG